jgi:hypothetical protein
MEDQHRRKIRAELDKYMKSQRPRLSPVKVAKFITDNQDKFEIFKLKVTTIHTESVRRFLNPKHGSITVGEDRVLLLEKYLEVVKSGAGAASKPRMSRNIQNDGLFFAVQDFFNMTPRKAAQYRDAVVGEYAFYAYSERGKDRVCLGAIEFSVNSTGAFTVKELQRSTPHGSNSVPA